MLNPCRAIFHFYPVSGDQNQPSTAKFDQNSLITVIRDTTDTLAGTVFAPQGKVFLSIEIKQCH